MINIICEVSKYLVLLFMVLYTVKCFSVLSSKNEEKKTKQTNRICICNPFLMLPDPVSAAGAVEDPDLLCGTDFCRHLVYGALPQHLQGFVQIADKQCIVFAVNRLYYAYASEF